jgi:hypothetical protein
MRVCVCVCDFMLSDKDPSEDFIHTLHVRVCVCVCVCVYVPRQSFVV